MSWAFLKLATAFSWGFRFAAQFIVLALLILALGALADDHIGVFVPPIPAAFVAYQVRPFRGPGKWLWLPGVVAMLWDTIEFGSDFAYGEFTSEVGLTVPLFTAACILYSSTLCMLPLLEKKDG